ncbi:hypothetical protein H9Q74_004329 [Fusarium xylarioides]|nr:hypothetical protein H9Q74_004329 [Fusarium xylarioides]
MSDAVPHFPNLTVTLDSGVGILALNRPASGNSLHPTVLQSLVGATKWAAKAASVRVIVLTGTGKFFTTGRDMGDNNALDNTDALALFREVNEVLIKCPKVLIAAVNGPAVGYGTTCFALFDMVYAVPEAYFFTPFSKWALCPEGCSSITFPSILGHQKAAALLLAGQRMTATELWTAGLVTKIIHASSNSEFMAQVLQITKQVASYPPVALAASKALFEGNRVNELLAANSRECECLRVRLEHQECKDGLLLFAREQQQKRVEGRRTRSSHI